MYLEVLTAPSVPSRIREVKRATPSSASGDSRGKGKSKGKNQSGVISAARWLAELEEVGDVIKETEMALKRIGEVMDRWEEVHMEVREHDYHVSERLDCGSIVIRASQTRPRRASRTD